MKLVRCKKKIPLVPDFFFSKDFWSTKRGRNGAINFYWETGITYRNQLLTLVLLFLPAQSALAHPGNHSIISFSVGLAHPWLGLDHLLVMVGMGLWSRSVQTKMSYRLPLAFLLCMVLGALLNYQGISLMWAEQGITMSLILLGGVLLLEKSASVRLLPPLLALFGLCHGYAHCAELENGHSQLGYLLGFVCSTIFLQMTGIGLACLNSIHHLHLKKSTGLSCLIFSALSVA